MTPILENPCREISCFPISKRFKAKRLISCRRLWVDFEFSDQVKCFHYHSLFVTPSLILNVRGARVYQVHICSPITVLRSLIFQYLLFLCAHSIFLQLPRTKDDWSGLQRSIGQESPGQVQVSFTLSVKTGRAILWPATLSWWLFHDELNGHITDLQAGAYFYPDTPQQFTVRFAVFKQLKGSLLLKIQPVLADEIAFKVISLTLVR